MKILFYIGLSFSIFTFTSVMASTPIIMPVEINKVYIPHPAIKGQNLKLYVKGNFSNQCNKEFEEVHILLKKSADTKVNLNELVYDDTDYFCPPAINQFFLPVDLGIYDPNRRDYQVNSEDLSIEFKEKLLSHDIQIPAIEYANLQGNTLFVNAITNDNCHQGFTPHFFQGHNTLTLVIELNKDKSRPCLNVLTKEIFEIEIPDEQLNHASLIVIKGLDHDYLVSRY